MVSLSSSLVSLMPLAGDQISSAIKGIWTFYKSAEMNRRARLITRMAPSVTGLDGLASAVARHVIINVIGRDEMARISERDNRQLKWWEKLQALANEVNVKISGERFSGAVGKTANEYASKLLTEMVTSREFFVDYLDASNPESQAKMICDEAEKVLSKKEEKPIKEEERSREVKGFWSPLLSCISPTKKKDRKTTPLDE